MKTHTYCWVLRLTSPMMGTNTHGVITINSDERWGLQSVRDGDEDSYLLLGTETHVTDDGNQYSHLSRDTMLILMRG
jgi:hypothetical protein